MIYPSHSQIAEKSTSIVNNDEGIKLTVIQKQLLEQVYQDYAPSTVRRKLTNGKSGAEVYLIERNDQRWEIAKFDHPYSLLPELKAYNELVTKTSPEYRVELRGKLIHQQDGKTEVGLIQSEDGKLGVLIYNFLGRGTDSADNSLLEYYKNNGGAKTALVLDNLFEAYGPQWWEKNTSSTVRYGEEYDRLLPVHLTLRRLRNPEDSIFLLQSEQLEWNKIRKLKIGQIVQLCRFEVTECQEDILRLRGLSPSGEHSPDLRVKLAGLNSEEYQPGDILKDTYAEIIGTRAQLLRQEAELSNVRFSSDDSIFTLHRKHYINPLPPIDAVLKESPRVKTSIIHGDLNLRNIMVHANTGFAWLIDFAHTRREGPILFDLQRLEEHAIAEILVPAMHKAKLHADMIIEVLKALEGDSPKPHAPNKYLQEAYKVLLKIRELAKQYLPRENGWQEYYRGLYLVLIGGLKYTNRNKEQRDVQLIAASHLLGLLPSTEETTPVKPKERPEMFKSIIVSVISSMVVTGLILFILFFLDGQESSSQISSIVGNLWSTTTTATPQPPVNDTVLARVIERKYLKCGVAGDIHRFSIGSPDAMEKSSKYINEADIGIGFYENAEGFDADFCKGMAAAIFGSVKNHVAFLNLGTDSESGKFERFTAVMSGTVDVAFRNTTWTSERALQVNFGPVTYFDVFKLMVYPELLPNAAELKTVQEALQAVRELFEDPTRNVKICVAVNTSTLDTLRKEFIGYEDHILEQDTNNQAKDTYSAGAKCQIIASDESQLRAFQSDYGSPNLKKAIIFPTDEGIAAEPLAPYVAKGDDEWLNLLNYTVWSIMYAEQLGIYEVKAKEIAAAHTTEQQRQIISGLSKNNNSLAAQIEEFLGIEQPEFLITKNFGLKSGFALHVISQIGNYEEIYRRNLKDFPRGHNCILNTIRSDNNHCWLTIPPQKRPAEPVDPDSLQ